MLRSLLLAPPAALWLLAAPTPTPGRVAMSWAQLLKRVFGIEIDTCQCCGGTSRIIASIEQPEVIVKIFAHLERTAPQPHPPCLPGMPGRGFGRADMG